MKANIPKSYKSLPPKEQEALRAFVAETLEELVVQNLDKEEVELQKIWIQYACIVLHRQYGFGKDRLLRFIAGWKRMYHQNAQFATKKEQSDALAADIDAIFGEGGYPHEWVDKLEKG